MTRALLLLALAGCGGHAADEAPRVAAPAIVTDALPVAETDKVYTAWLEASDGTPPLRWTVEGELPEGLVLNPAGAISGLPKRVGDHAVTVTVTDDEGRSDSAELDLSVVLSGDLLHCGTALDGEFTEVGWLDWYEVDWDAPGGFAWVQIPLPDEDTTRVELEVGSWLTAYLAAPGTPLGDTDLWNNYRNYYLAPGYSITVDLGTTYDLDAYRSYGDPISVLLVADEPGAWLAGAACTDGPIFTDLSFPPVALGEPLSLNYSVHRDNTETRIWTDDPLPDWVAWDETNGKVTGVAGEVGLFEYDVSAEAPDGDTRTEATGFGVYEVLPLPCDTSHVWTADEGYYEGHLAYSSDPTGYVLLETPMDPTISRVSATLDGLLEGRVGLSDPASQPYYSTSNSASTWNGGPITAEALPWTWPDVGTYLEAGAAGTMAYAYYGSNRELTLTVECDRAPRPDLFALPVLEPGGAESHVIDVIGGTPPYVFAAEGLPAGVTLDPTGVLSTDAPVAGTATVSIMVEDALGAATTTALPLHTGDLAACRGYPQLACGDSASGNFTGPYWEDFYGTSGVETFCLPPSVTASARLELVTTSFDDGSVAALVGHPGTTDEASGLYTGRYTWLGSASGNTSILALDDGARPPLSAWDGIPAFLSLVAYAAGDWAVELDCE